MLVAIRRGRLPDFRRPEMRVIWIGVSDALNDRNHPLVVERFERTHLRVEADMRIDCQDVVAGDRQPRSQLIVAIVAMRHDAVQTVVTAVQVDQNKASVLAARESRQRRLGERAREDVPGVCDNRQSRGSGKQEISPFHGVVNFNWYAGVAIAR